MEDKFNIVETPVKPVINLGPGFDIAPQTFAEAQAWCDYISRSDLVPEAYRTPAGSPESKGSSVYVAIMRGKELGLAPLQALTSINVIKGRPSLSTDAKKALCMRYGRISQKYTDDDGNPRWTVTVRRSGQDDVEITYSAIDAAQAGLMSIQTLKDGSKVWAGKQNSAWAGYWKRMLLKRATSWALDEAFPDVLNGFATTEDLNDLDIQSPVTVPVKAVAAAEPEPNVIEMPAPANEEPTELDTDKRILNKLKKEQSHVE